MTTVRGLRAQWHFKRANTSHGGLNRECFGRCYIYQALNLKETWEAGFQVHIFWREVTTMRGVVMLKIRISFLILSHTVPLCGALILAPVTLTLPPAYPISSDWSAHTRLSHDPSPCLRSALLCFSGLQWASVNYTNVWHGVVVESLLTRCFRHCIHFSLCGKDELLFRLFNIQDLLTAWRTYSL